MKHLLAALVWAVFATSAWASCSDARVDLRGEWGQARFSVEVAESPEEISRGLMHRTSMPASAGMIFIYPSPRPATFWMRNTLIPLDMIFVSADGVVQKIHENAIPRDETIIFGGDEIQYVLEINGGMASRIGITVGTELRHPKIDSTIAAWPCT